MKSILLLLLFIIQTTDEGDMMGGNGYSCMMKSLACFFHIRHHFHCDDELYFIRGGCLKILFCRAYLERSYQTLSSCNEMHADAYNLPCLTQDFSQDVTCNLNEHSLNAPSFFFSLVSVNFVHLHRNRRCLST